MVALLACGIGLGSAATLTLLAFRNKMELFLTPSQLAGAPPPGQAFRIGGLVLAGSVDRTTIGGEPTATFRLTDTGAARVTVAYTGILPDLFREGQGIVALGTLRSDGTFAASEVLAKHDASYMPKDVAEALKASGQWKPETGQAPPLAWNTAAKVSP